MTPATIYQLRAAPHSFSFESDCSVIEAAPGADGVAALPRFSMVAYTGGPFRPRMTPSVKYPVVVDLAGLDISNQQIPAIKDHNSQLIVGHSESIANDGKQLLAEGVISGTGPAAREVRDNAKNGFPWKVSIGAEVSDLEFIPHKQSVSVNGRLVAGPVYVARSGVLNDLSFCPEGPT